MTNIEDDGTVPTKEEDNWSAPGLNNYRQNYIDNVFAAPDVVIASVWPECEGEYGLYARVRNIGEQAIPHGVTVNFYAGDPEMGGVQIGTTNTTKELYPAEAEDVFVALPDAPADLLDGSELGFAVVNPMETWLECRPANNSGEGSGVCE